MDAESFLFHVSLSINEDCSPEGQSFQGVTGGWQVGSHIFKKTWEIQLQPVFWTVWMFGCCYWYETQEGHSSQENTENGVQSIQTATIQWCCAKTSLMTTRQQKGCWGIILHTSGAKLDKKRSFKTRSVSIFFIILQGSSLRGNCRWPKLSEQRVVGIFWLSNAPQYWELSWEPHKEGSKEKTALVNNQGLQICTVPLEEGPLLWGGCQDTEWLCGCPQTLGLSDRFQKGRSSQYKNSGGANYLRWYLFEPFQGLWINR